MSRSEQYLKALEAGEELAEDGAGVSPLLDDITEAMKEDPWVKLEKAWERVLPLLTKLMNFIQIKWQK